MSTEPPANIFNVIDLSYSYDGRTHALEDISLEVNTGECVAIMGSNGCGKSTMLKILDGLFFPSHGSVSAFGNILTEQAFQQDAFNAFFRRRVGLVFQDSDVQLFMPSVWDEVAFAPLQLDLAHSEVIANVEAALSALNISRLRDRAPHQLSDGEKKRVALASVLSLSPDVWLMDEPSAGLDPRSVRWLIHFISTQWQTGKTVVIASHDLQLVASVANRVYILDEDHHLLACGSTHQILDDQSLLNKANLV